MNFVIIFIIKILEKVKRIWYNPYLMITKENKQKAFASTQMHKDDVGSPQAQVAVLTQRIKEITTHLKQNKHDYMASRGLIRMVSRRKKLLKYLEDKDFDSYKKTVSTLKLRK